MKIRSKLTARYIIDVDDMLFNVEGEKYISLDNKDHFFPIFKPHAPRKAGRSGLSESSSSL